MKIDTIACGILLALVVDIAQANVTIDVGSSVIVSPGGATRQAALELQVHLAKITGVTVPIEGSAKDVTKYPFYLEQTVLGDNDETCAWEIGETAAHFRGKALFAVLDFLENSVGVRWPGGDIIIAPTMNPLVVSVTKGTFSPKLNIRIIRHDSANGNAEFARRMRTGSHDAPLYGHAFTTYWKRFGETHPEFFAMREDGVRAPRGITKDELDQDIATLLREANGNTVGMCVSSTGFQHQVVADWVESGAPEYLNLCENDISGSESCQCAECRAHDAPIPSDADLKACHFYADRYVWFGNEILQMARRIRPDVKVCYYAYNGTQDPPCRYRPDPDSVIGLVPTVFTEEAIDAFLDGWKTAGLNCFFFRPNMHHYYSMMDLPPGYEEHYFKIFQKAFKAGSVGFDYDANGVGRQYLGWFERYVLFHAMQDPSKSFAYWEDHYFSAFGAAKDDVRDYYRFWRREVWEARIAPDLSRLTTIGKWYNVGRGVAWHIGDYYSVDDFDRCEHLLARAFERPLTQDQRTLVRTLWICHKHGRLFVKAAVEKTVEATQLLAAFRDQYGFSRYTWAEQYFGDICGMEKVFGPQPEETSGDVSRWGSGTCAFYPFTDRTNGANLSGIALTNAVSAAFFATNMTVAASPSAGVFATNAVPGRYLVVGPGYQSGGPYATDMSSLRISRANGDDANASFNGKSGSTVSFDGLAAALSRMEAWTVETYLFIPKGEYVSYAPVLAFDAGLSYHGAETQIKLVQSGGEKGQWRVFLPEAPYMTAENKSTDKYPIIAGLKRSNLNVWMHLALTYTRADGRLRLYVDHAEKGSVVLPFVKERQGENLSVGNFEWSGILCGLRVTARALVPEEMLYSGDVATGCAVEAFHLPFEETLPVGCVADAVTNSTEEVILPDLVSRKTVKVCLESACPRVSSQAVRLSSVPRENGVSDLFAKGSRVMFPRGAIDAVYGDFTMEGFFRFDSQAWEEKVADKLTDGKPEGRPFCSLFSQQWVSEGRVMWELAVYRLNGVYYPRVKGTLRAEDGSLVSFTERLQKSICISDGAWHHYALVYDHDIKALMVFEDGGFIGMKVLDYPLALDGQRTSVAGNNTAYVIGYNNISQAYDGLIDEVRLMRRMLPVEDFLQVRDLRGLQMLVW